MKLKTMSDKDRLYKMSIVDTETMCWNWIGTLKGTDKLRKIKKNIEEVIDPKTGSVKTSSPKTKESFNWETWAQSF